MNILLWVLQVFLALHTLMGAGWKLSRSAAQTMPSLKAIPDGVWRSMSVLELLCSVALIAGALTTSLAILAPVAAACIAGEMLLFCVVHLASRASKHGPMIYWLVVAALCAFIAYGRLALAPVQ